MKRCISNLVVLGVFYGAVFGPGTRVAAQAPGPDQIGQWGPILNWPLEAIHMILLKNGKVLCVYDREFGTDKFMLFDPDPAPGEDSVTVISTRPLDSDGLPIELFCSGHSQLPDGRIVFVGGGKFYDVSHAHTVIFDPDAAATPCTVDTDCTAFTGKCDVNAGLCDPWKVMVDMPEISPGVEGIRWYPTLTGMGDGTVLVVGGDREEFGSPYTHTADIPLIFDQAATQQYTELTSAELHLPFYPFNFQLSDGTVLYAGSDFASGACAEPPELSCQMVSKNLDPDPTLGTWTNLTTVADPIKGGSAVMYGPDLIMKGAGFVNPGEKVYSLDATSANPEWIQLASMNR